MPHFLVKSLPPIPLWVHTFPVASDDTETLGKTRPNE